MATEIALSITLGGETRSINFKVVRENDLALSLPVFAARIGNGVKAHRVQGEAWFRNGQWVFTTATMVLNRNARITGWVDSVTCNKSDHVGSRI